jgi:hypothetical protein
VKQSHQHCQRQPPDQTSPYADVTLIVYSLPCRPTTYALIAFFTALLTVTERCNVNTAQHNKVTVFFAIMTLKRSKSLVVARVARAAIFLAHDDLFHVSKT